MCRESLLRQKSWALASVTFQGPPSRSHQPAWRALLRLAAQTGRSVGSESAKRARASTAPARAAPPAPVPAPHLVHLVGITILRPLGLERKYFPQKGRDASAPLARPRKETISSSGDPPSLACLSLCGAEALTLCAVGCTLRRQPTAIWGLISEPNVKICNI